MSATKSELKRQQKYFKSREGNDALYYFMARIGRIGIDAIAEKAPELLPIERRDVMH
jgi:hypothetical protein